MKIVIKPNSRAASEHVAGIFKAQLQRKPDSVLGLATGKTPLETYAELVRLHREEGLDFSRATTFNLDEYLGVDPGHPGSFHRFMQENFFRFVNLDPARIHIPDGLCSDPGTTCAGYERSILEAGGIDLQLLGLGRDGHIGFNEPGSPLRSRTRVEELTLITRNDNAAAFGGVDRVPERAITMGIGTILEARKIVLLVIGRRKAEVVRAAIEGPVTTMVPGSVLQFHRDVTVVLDEPAAFLLEGVRSYRRNTGDPEELPSSLS